MSKLTVVYLKDSGHVLAALTRADPPAAGEPVGALVNKGLPVSAVDAVSADVTVPVTNLAAVTVDDNQPDVLINPQHFQVVQDPSGQTPPQVASIGLAAGNVALTIDTTSGAQVVVSNVFTAVSLPAVVVLQKLASPSPAPTILDPVTVTLASPTVVADPAGFVIGDTWNMYAFVQGVRPAASAITIMS
jgi:hypothetical protein